MRITLHWHRMYIVVQENSNLFSTAKVSYGKMINLNTVKLLLNYISLQKTVLHDYLDVREPLLWVEPSWWSTRLGTHPGPTGRRSDGGNVT